jgi:hypothetical protein
MNKGEYLNAQTKSRLINSLETGDLVKFKADILMPFIYHFGIISIEDSKLYFYHLQTEFENQYGGNLLRDDFKEYAKGREILEVQKLKLNREDFQNVLESLKKSKYDVFNNNCEHFIYFLKEKKFVSPQLKIWGLAVTLGVITYFILKRK